MTEPKIRFKCDDGSSFPAWEQKKLGDITVKIERKSSEDSNVPVMMISQGNGFIYQSDKYSRENAGQSLKKYTLLRRGEFAYNHGASKAKPYGVTYVLQEEDEARVPFVYHTFEIVEGVKEYWHRALNTNQMDRQLKKLVSSGVRMDGLLNINYDTYMDVAINAPSLPEQQKIADFLSNVDEVIAASEEEVTNLEQQKKAVMQKIFSQEVRFKKPDGSDFPDWEEKKIVTFAKCFAGATPSTTVKEYWENGTIQWMSSGEVNNRYIYQTEKKISQLGYDKCSTKMVKPNTVVMALAGQGKTRGTVAITRTALCTNQSLCAIETNEEINDEYLFQYLYSQYENLRQISSGDGGRGGLNLQLVNDYMVPVPSLPEQQKIADFLTSYDEAITAAKQELEKWKELKKGLLQQMFV